MASVTRVVLLDIDEVLFPFAHAYDRWLRRTEGFGLDPEYVARYDIPTAAGPEPDQLVVRFLSDPDVIHGETAIPESLAVVNRLSSEFRLMPAPVDTGTTRETQLAPGSGLKFRTSKTSSSRASVAADAHGIRPPWPGNWERSCSSTTHQST